MSQKVLALFLGVVLVATACARPTPTPTPAPGAPAAPTPGTPIAGPKAPTPPPTVAPPVLKPTGELRIASGSLVAETLDPILSAATAKIYLGLIYDHMVGSTKDGKASTETGLAQRWEVSADAKTFTFYLRQGAKFHNGEEVTAEDVKFSIERVMSPRATSSYAGVVRRAIASMEVKDRYTLVIRAKEPSLTLLYDLSMVTGNEGMVVPKKYVQEKGEDNFAVNPIGSGPYRLKEHVVGSYIKLEAVENHWRVGVPRYKTLTLFLVPEETTRLAMLKTGYADWVDVSKERVKEARAAGFQIWEAQGTEHVVLWVLQQTEGPLRNKKVREAVNLAINRQEIRDYLFEGMGVMVGNFVPSWALGREPLAPYPFDPDKAKKLLGEEGYADGFPLTILSYNRPGLPEGPKMMETIAGYLTKIGVKPKITPMDYGAALALRKKQQVHGLGYVNAANRPFPHGLFTALYHSKLAGFGALVTDPKIDAMLDEMLAQTDLNQYAQKVAATDRYFYENHLSGPMLEVGVFFAATKKVERWEQRKVMYDWNIESIFTR